MICMMLFVFVVTSFIHSFSYHCHNIYQMAMGAAAVVGSIIGSIVGGKLHMLKFSLFLPTHAEYSFLHECLSNGFYMNFSSPSW